MSTAQWTIVAIAALILVIELVAAGKFVLNTQWSAIFHALNPNTKALTPNNPNGNTGTSLTSPIDTSGTSGTGGIVIGLPNKPTGPTWIGV